MSDSIRLASFFGGVALAITVAGVSAGEIDEQRARELQHLLVQECGSCHGLQLTGGLGPPLTPDALEDRGDIGLKAVILHGVPGTAMPPWKGLLTEEEAEWLVDFLREGL